MYYLIFTINLLNENISYEYIFQAEHVKTFFLTNLSRVVIFLVFST